MSKPLSAAAIAENAVIQVRQIVGDFIKVNPEAEVEILESLISESNKWEERLEVIEEDL